MHSMPIPAFPRFYQERDMAAHDRGAVRRHAHSRHPTPPHRVGYDSGRPNSHRILRLLRRRGPRTATRSPTTPALESDSVAATTVKTNLFSRSSPFFRL